MLWPRPCLSTSWRRSLATSLERSNMKSQGYLSTYQRIDLLRIFSAYFRRTSPFSPLCNVKGRLWQLQGSWGSSSKKFSRHPHLAKHKTENHFLPISWVCLKEISYQTCSVVRKSLYAPIIKKGYSTKMFFTAKLTNNKDGGNMNYSS